MGCAFSRCRKAPATEHRPNKSTIETCGGLSNNYDEKPEATQPPRRRSAEEQADSYRKILPSNPFGTLPKAEAPQPPARRSAEEQADSYRKMLGLPALAGGATNRHARSDLLAYSYH